MRLGFEVGPRTGINVLVTSVIHRVRTNPEVKIVMPKGGGLDPRGRADPISPNFLIGFAARCSLQNLYKFSLLFSMKKGFTTEKNVSYQKKLEKKELY